MSLILPDNLSVPMDVRRQLGIPGGVMTVQFGQWGPLDSPGGYRYEVPEEKRRRFEQAVKDSKSADIERSSLARSAIIGGLREFPLLGPLFGMGGSVVMNILGFGLVANLSTGVSSSVTGSYRHDGNSPVWPATVRSYASRTSWRVDGGRWYLEIDATNYIEKWEHAVYSGKRHYWATAGNIGVEGAASRRPINWFNNNPPADPWGPPTAFSTPTTGIDPSGYPAPHNDGKQWATNFILRADGPIDRAACYRFYAQDYLGDPNHTYLNPEDKEMRYFGPACLPTADGSLFDFGEDPFGGIEDLEKLPNELDPTDSHFRKEDMDQLLRPIEDSEWCEKYCEPFEGLHPKDPNWPCNPGSGSPLPGDDFDQGIVKPGDGFQITQPGGPDFPGDGFTPGDPICFIIDGKKVCGEIGGYDPPEIIGTFPPYPDEFFTKPRCYKKKLAVEIVRELAEELGLKPNIGWIIDVSCKKRFTGCFKKGTSKWDAMWAMADLCGYGIFPEPDMPGIGEIKPLPIHHGPYHEHRDLFVFNPAKDDLDIPSHVEIYRPRGRFNRGYSVVAEVAAAKVYKLKDKWYSELAPRGTSEADAMDIAATKANQFNQLASYLEFAVPFNDKIKSRHQIKCQIPSAGFTANYMAWEIEHNVDINEGSITVVRGIELKRWRYAPRFDSWETVWGNSGIIR